MKFTLISAAPEAFTSYLNTSILARGIADNKVEVEVVDLRDFGEGSYNVIDDKPFGGGPGMVLKIEPIEQAIRSVQQENSHVVLFSTRGATYTQHAVRRLSTHTHIIAICGRYEGVDQRVAEHLVDEEISLGPYVLTGGELPALVLVDSIARLIPGVLGTYDSLEDIKGSYPSYTRPASYTSQTGEVWEIPEVLRSGDHSKINAWRNSFGE